MALPNPSMSFSPFAILTAEEMNDLVANIQALAAGTGFNTGAIPTAALADKGVTPQKATNPYVARVKRTTSQSVAPSTWTKAQLNSEDFDPNSNFDSATNFRYTAPVSGIYLVTASQVYSGALFASLVGLYINGVSYETRASDNRALTDNFAQITDFIHLTAGDYIELWTWNNYGGGGNAAMANANLAVGLFTAD